MRNFRLALNGRCLDKEQVLTFGVNEFDVTLVLTDSPPLVDSYLKPSDIEIGKTYTASLVDQHGCEDATTKTIIDNIFCKCIGINQLLNPLNKIDKINLRFEFINSVNELI